MSDLALYVGARDLWRILLCLGVVLVVGVVAGVLVSTFTSASLMVVRDGGECVAVDQDKNGAEVGRWQPRDGRCLLRDWRVWHPFGG